MILLPGLRNLLLVYLDPDLFKVEEAERDLQERGIDIQRIRDKGDKFIKKLEAKNALMKSGEKSEE